MVAIKICLNLTINYDRHGCIKKYYKIRCDDIAKLHLFAQVETIYTLIFYLSQ